jgi:hypothetical protein
MASGINLMSTDPSLEMTVLLEEMKFEVHHATNSGKP